ncbi:hypothetical protein PFISCL1PPCAC_14379, partial [Pristionchus fissidentatus]
SPTMLLLPSVLISLAWVCAAEENSAQTTASSTTEESPNWCVDTLNFGYCPGAANHNEGRSISFLNKFQKENHSRTVVDYLAEVFNVDNMNTKEMLAKYVATTMNFTCSTKDASAWPLSIYKDCVEFTKKIFDSVIILMYANPEMRDMLSAVAKNHKVTYADTEDSKMRDAGTILQALTEPWKEEANKDPELLVNVVNEIQKALRTAAGCTKLAAVKLSDYFVQAFKSRESGECKWTAIPIAPSATAAEAPSTTITAEAPSTTITTEAPTTTTISIDASTSAAPPATTTTTGGATTLATLFTFTATLITLMY